MLSDQLVVAGRVTAGFSLVVAGIAMLVLPGPGVVAIAAGLAVMERDVPVARRLMTAARAQFSRSIARGWLRAFRNRGGHPGT